MGSDGRQEKGRQGKGREVGNGLQGGSKMKRDR
jgi:hypothetical protein